MNTLGSLETKIVVEITRGTTVKELAVDLNLPNPKLRRVIRDLYRKLNLPRNCIALLTRWAIREGVIQA